MEQVAVAEVHGTYGTRFDRSKRSKAAKNVKSTKTRYALRPTVSLALACVAII